MIPPATDSILVEVSTSAVKKLKALLVCEELLENKKCKRTFVTACTTSTT